jgi:hypothetical protein
VYQVETLHFEIGSTKAQLIKIPRSVYWYLRFSDGGKRVQISTRCKDELAAKDWATNWLMIAKGRLEEGQSISGTSFKKFAYKFLDHEQITKGAARNPRHISNMREIADNWLIPFFHDYRQLTLEEIKTKHIDEFLVWRLEHSKKLDSNVNIPSPQTQRHYIQVLRRILKYSINQGVIDILPLFPTIRLTKHNRGWFEPDEYELLKKVSHKRIAAAPTKKVKQRREYLHQFIIFAVGCGGRTYEILGLKHKGVQIVHREGEESFVRLTVNGKTGAHEITAMPSSRWAYRDILKHNEKYGISSEPDSLVFPQNPHMALRELLKAAGIYEDKFGRPRSARNFRHTSIMFRLLNSQNLDIKALADNLNTSVATIDNHYAEISNRLNEEDLLSMKSRRL